MCKLADRTKYSSEPLPDQIQHQQKLLKTTLMRIAGIERVENLATILGYSSIHVIACGGSCDLNF